MKYYVKIVVEKVLTYEVEANNEEESIDKVNYGEVEPYDSETLDTDVIECYPIETDTPLEGCRLFD